MGPKRVEVDLESLELLPDEKSASARAHRSNTIRVFREEPETSQQRLHLVGLRVEEAIPLLDKTLDRAILDGYNQIHVVHGHVDTAPGDFARQCRNSSLSMLSSRDFTPRNRVLEAPGLRW
jgi:dsDNA-specific endonuclease/ATPase MutS2